MPLNAKLVVVGGEVKTAEIKLRLPSTIGRGRGATIMLPHPLVSRQHCELFEFNGRLMVRDLGSLNGTFINSERISEAALPSGELLTVGAVTFRAVYDAQDSSGPPAGAGPPMKSAQIRDTDPNGTMRGTADKKPAPPAAEAQEVVEVEFNFEQPLAHVDDVLPPSTIPAGHKTDATAEAIADAQIVEEPSLSNKPTTPAKPSSAAAKPTPSSPPTKPDDKAVDFSKWEQEDSVRPKGEEDDDFGDFLKSLGTK